MGDARQGHFQPCQIGSNIIVVRFQGLRHVKGFVRLRLTHPKRLRCRVNSASKPSQMPQNFAPCVIVYSISHAEAVLRVGNRCILLSSPGAALAGGVAWWQELVALARSRVPATACIDILDCGDAPGIAMAALRMRQAIMVLRPSAPGFAAVARAAAAQGATVLTEPPFAIDMALRNDQHRLATHLRSQTQQLVTGGDRDTPGTLR